MSTWDEDCSCEAGAIDPCDPDYKRGFRVVHPMERGDTKELEYTLLDRDGIPIDVSDPDVKIWFTIKRYLSEADSQALWQGTLASGVAAIGAPVAGKVRVTVPASATSWFPEGIEKLYYDLQVKEADGRLTTREKGLFRVSPDVTRATT